MAEIKKYTHMPNISTRNDGNWTGKAAADGMVKHKGIEYKAGEMPLDVWEKGIEMSGDENYWRENDYKRFKAWCKKDSEFN